MMVSNQSLDSEENDTAAMLQTHKIKVDEVLVLKFH